MDCMPSQILLKWRATSAALIIVSALSACGGREPPAQDPLASTSSISVEATQQGVTPFISFIRLRASNLDRVVDVKYMVEPKAGSVSQPVAVSYAMPYLKRRGYASIAVGQATIPVFGLYAGYTNKVVITVRFDDSSTQTLRRDVAAAAYTDPNGTYDRPRILKARAAGTTLGFDFFYMKSLFGTPVVVDTDGEIRWVGPGSSRSSSSTFDDNGFVVGDPASIDFRRLELDGSVSAAMLISPTYTKFHHNIDPGKIGLLAEVDAAANGSVSLESILAEFNGSGAILNAWDLGAILSRHMASHGDDPTAFVRPGVDWFHMNAATYDSRDDSLIVSSRENFVVKIDYRTGDLIWILGDPSKYWYTFPSLRAKSLTLSSGGLYPIGQHGISITSDGLLMLFNNGTASVNQPIGAPVGEGRIYSAVSAYSIDASGFTAREVWRFDYDKTILSNVCSSAYESRGKSILVSYAAAANGTTARLVGLDESRNVVFDFEYASARCAVSWNAEPIRFDDLKFH
jgi:hypothetical protein